MGYLRYNEYGDRSDDVMLPTLSYVQQLPDYATTARVIGCISELVVARMG